MSRYSTMSTTVDRASSPSSLPSPLIMECSTSSGKDTLTVNFHHATFTFHAQWLHDARCDQGSSRIAGNAFCQQSTKGCIHNATVAGQGLGTTVAVTWDDRTVTHFPALWLRVLAPVVAKRHGCEPVTPPSRPKGWLVETVDIPEFSYPEVFSEDSSPEHVDNTRARIFDSLLLASAAGIIKITGLPAPDIEGERSQKNNLVTQILKRIFGTVFQHPMRGPDQTFLVATRYQEDNIRAMDLPNYDTDQVLLPHVDHAHYENPIRIQGFYGLEGQSENTFVSGLAALETLKEESSDLFAKLCTAPMVVGRVAHFYNPSLFQACVDTAVTMEPGSPDKIKRIRWHPHLTGSLLASFDTFGDARLAHQKFQEIIRRKTHQLRVILQPGDLYLWDNFRVLHGRERVLEVPRTGIGQTVPEQVVTDQYRALSIKRLAGIIDKPWLVHMPTSQLHDLVDLVESGINKHSPASSSIPSLTKKLPTLQGCTNSRLCATATPSPPTIQIAPPEAPWYAAYPSPRSTDPASITRAQVLQWLRDGKLSGDDFVLVDLRKMDCEGGTIRSSINLPAQSLYPTIPTLYMLLSSAKVEKVIWYCGSSGGRGTRAAAWFEDYIREQGDSVMKSYTLAEGIKGWARGGREYVEWMDGYDETVWKM